MAPFNRRNFLRASGLSVIPGLLAGMPALAGDTTIATAPPDGPPVRFFYDGEWFSGPAYWEQLQLAHAKTPVKVDRYGMGGAVEALEKKFEAITGKEKAIFMPSGTMANQLAIAVLSGENSKVYVQETSHVFRDEADAAQTVFNKRLVPLAPGATYFTAEALQAAVEGLQQQEAFSTGIGCVSIENPVRRTDGRMVPIEEIRKISTYCRSKGIKLHLDGARLYMASAWSGVSIKEYASYFDTVYISLYKYLGASAGAVLCGDKAVIDKMPHLMKIHGGTMFGNWLNAAMALYRVEGVEERLQQAIKRSAVIFEALNTIPGMKVAPLDGGTNIYQLQLPPGINGNAFKDQLIADYNIMIPPPGEKGSALITVNETLLHRDTDYMINAFRATVKKLSA